MAFEFFPISNYAAEETARVQNELPTLCNGDFRFAFMPDYHYKYIREMRVSFSNIVHMLNKLNEKAKIDFFCLGGDNVGNYPNSKEEHIEMMEDLAKYFPYLNVPVITVQGNHDDNSIHGALSGTHICRADTVVPNEIQYDALFSQHENIENFHLAHKKALYGYLDVPSADARVIFLDSTDVPFILDGDILRYNQQWDFGYTGRQLTWLANIALQNAPKNIVFIEHIPFNNEERVYGEKEDPRYNFEALNAITAAFRDGESIHIISDHPDFGYDISAAFNGEKHNIIARIGGHIHIDTAHIDKAGFLDITSMLGGRKASGLIANEDGTKFEREPFSKNETAIDIFTISPTRGKIFITRYGSGRSREIDI